MNADPLSDLLRSVHLRGAIYYYVNFRDDWVAETPGSGALAQALMPGAEHVMAYHLMLRGDGWAATRAEPPVRLAAGDLVMFPRGDGHVLSSAPGMRAAGRQPLAVYNPQRSEADRRDLCRWRAALPRDPADR